MMSVVKMIVRFGIIGAIVARRLDAQSVSVTAGNIVFHPLGGVERRITGGGLDSMPNLSFDGRWIVFVRRTPRDTVNTSLGWEERTELWVIRADGSNARRLLRGREGNAPESTLADFGNPLFSPDGRTVYFASRGWVTSDALHAVEVVTGRERFICGANTFELLTVGRYRGDLMVGQHRYGTSGSFDGTWIVSPHGKILRQVTTDGAPDADARIAATRAGKLPETRPPTRRMPQAR
jgi:hypothetical protein